MEIPNLPDLSPEEIRNLYSTDPEAFMRMYKQVFSLQEELARYDINFFIQYVIKWEGRNEYVRQAPVHVDLQKFINSNPQTLIWGAVGIGKAQPLESHVLTPSGWVRIADLHVGDSVLGAGSVGEITGMTPIVEEEIVEFVTASGRVVRSTLDHTWPCAVGSKYLMTSAREIHGILNDEPAVAKKRPSVRLRIVNPPLRTEPSLNPYFFGVIVGGLLSRQPIPDRIVPILTKEFGEFSLIRKSGKNVFCTELGALALLYKDQLKPDLSGTSPAVRDLWLWNDDAKRDFLTGFSDTTGAVVGRTKLVVANRTTAEMVAGILTAAGSPHRVHERHVGRGSVQFSVEPHAATAYEQVVRSTILSPRKARCIQVSTPGNTYITDNMVLTHNCVTPTTVFIDSHGCPVIAEDLRREYVLGYRNEVLDFDLTRYRPRYVPVKSIEENGEVGCHTICTDNGMRMTVSGNHPVYASKFGVPNFIDAELIRTNYLAATYHPIHQDLPLDEEAFAVGALLAATQADPDPKDEPAQDLFVRYRCRLRGELWRRFAGLPILRRCGVTVEASTRTVLVPAALLERYGFTPCRASIRGFRGRHILITPEVAPAAASLAAGIFSVVASWSNYPTGVFKLCTSGRIIDTLRWALYAAGIPCRIAKSSSEHGTFLYLETGIASGFLKRVASAMPEGEAFELASAAVEIFDQRKIPLGDARERQAMGTWTRRTTRNRKSDDDYRGYRFSRVVYSGRAGKQRTLAVEVDSDQHTFITDGIFTHNTQQVSVARTLFWLGQNPNLRILIFMSSQDIAKDTLRQIKDYIANSPRYRRVFPHVKPGAKWAEYEILVQRQFESVTPSVRVIGTSTMIDGSRYDKIIGDDALSLNNTQTAGERDRIHKWIETVPLSRMADNCQVVIIGNAYHKDDAMHRLEKLPGWKSRRYPARDPVTGKSLLPTIWSQERLELWKKTKSPTEFRRAIDVVPWTNESAKFKIEWFTAAFTRGRNVHVENGVPVHFRTFYNLAAEQEMVREARASNPSLPMPIEVVAGIDVGFGLTENADHTAIFCGVPYDNGDLCILYYAKGRMTESEKLEEIYRLHANYGAVIYVEANFTQAYFYDRLRDTFPEATILPWRTRGDGTVGNKWHTLYGVASLELDFSKGKIILPSVATPDGTEEIHPLLGDLVDGFINYTADRASHTHDGIMALWIMSQGARIRGGTEYLAGLIGRDGVEAASAYFTNAPQKETPVSRGSIDASTVWGSLPAKVREVMNSANGDADLAIEIASTGHTRPH